MLQRNYYNDRVTDMVVKCHRDIVEIMQQNSISKIMFAQHEAVLQDGIPYVTFNDDDNNYSCVELGEITLNNYALHNYEDLVYTSSDQKYSGYTDGFYGDNFDVAESLPKIYAAVCDIINTDDIKENERS